jgi:hypothetical protein
LQNRGACLSEVRTEEHPLTEDPKKLRAEIRARQAEDGKKAMAEYEANAAALRARTQKLREARLAREAAEPAEAPAPKKAKKSTAKTKSATKAKTPPGKLSDWLDERGKSGHST